MYCICKTFKRVFAEAFSNWAHFENKPNYIYKYEQIFTLPPMCFVTHLKSCIRNGTVVQSSHPASPHPATPPRLIQPPRLASSSHPASPHPDTRLASSRHPASPHPDTPPRLVQTPRLSSSRHPASPRPATPPRLVHLPRLALSCHPALLSSHPASPGRAVPPPYRRHRVTRRQPDDR